MNDSADIFKINIVDKIKISVLSFISFLLTSNLYTKLNELTFLM